MQASSSSVQAASSASEDVLHHDMHEDTVKRLHPEHNEYTGYTLFGKKDNSLQIMCVLACKYDGSITVKQLFE